MPGRRRKNFKTFRDVAKDGASFFDVGYRSQRDPMLADSEASEHVLVPKGADEKQLEEQMKYGIYYEDDYDYLQHLKDVNELPERHLQELPSFELKEADEEDDEDMRSVSGISSSGQRLLLPSSAMGSGLERDVGMLNMAAPSPGPKLDWDPDIVAGLDDDFNFDDPDNELEDDFMQMANADSKDLQAKLAQKADAKQEEDSDDESLGSDSDNSVQLSDDDEWTDDEDEDEGMTNFTRMSSAVLPRNDKLRLLDDQTEALMRREYTEDQIGALDCEELDGRVTFESDLFMQCLQDFQKEEKPITMKDIVDSEDRVRPVIPETWLYVEDKDYSVEDPEPEDVRDRQPLYTPKKPQFDCQSILSTYSRGKNLPTVIGLPEDLKKKNKAKKKLEAMSDMVSDSTAPGLSLKELEQQVRVERLADAPTTYRPKGETGEERRERKKAVKDHKKERRVEKKINKLAFQSEMKQQSRVAQSSELQKKMTPLQS